MIVFSRISTKLKEEKRSQKDLTDFLGVNQSVYTQWKKGENSSYRKHIDKIADYLNTTTDYLLGKTDNPNLPEDKEIRDEDIKFALFGGEQGITDEMFAKVKEFAKFVKETERGKKNDGK